MSANIEIGCCLSDFKLACRENKKVLSDVSSLFICRQEIYVCSRKQMNCEKEGLLDQVSLAEEPF